MEGNRATSYPNDDDRWLTPPRAGALLVWLFMWGTFLLRVPVVLMVAFALAASFFGAAFVIRGRVDGLGGLILANYALWLLSGLLTGGVVWSDLISPDFYSNDGRGFLYYVPLLFFSVYEARQADLKLVWRTLAGLSIGSLLLYGVWAIARPAVLSGSGAADFVALFTSHTGAGTFFGVLATFLLILGYERRDRSLQLLGLAMVLPVFGSGSRQALLSLLVAIGWFVIRHGNRRSRLGLSAALALALALLMFPVVSPHTFERTARVFSSRTLELAFESYRRFDSESTPDQELGSSESNIMSRFILWRYAAKRFAESPIVGIGFGRYNDVALRLEGTPGLVYVAVDGSRQTNVANAHNMYLHQAAETGLLGLSFLGLLWLTLFRRLVPERSIPSSHPVSAAFTAAQGLVIFTLVSALFDNALVAPSVGIPVLTVCGILISYQRRAEARVAVA